MTCKLGYKDIQGPNLYTKELEKKKKRDGNGGLLFEEKTVTGSYFQPMKIMGKVTISQKSDVQITCS